jgi:hypothetical protein
MADIEQLHQTFSDVETDTYPQTLNKSHYGFTCKSSLDASHIALKRKWTVWYGQNKLLQEFSRRGLKENMTQFQFGRDMLKDH